MREAPHHQLSSLTAAFRVRLRAIALIERTGELGSEMRDPIAGRLRSRHGAIELRWAEEFNFGFNFARELKRYFGLNVR